MTTVKDKAAMERLETELFETRQELLRTIWRAESAEKMIKRLFETIHRLESAFRMHEGKQTFGKGIK